ncbi:hypothetical protein AB07_0337 [Citrobacter freundii]|nr:hypothetical protein AB07_0337 [Citrobacter freundii]
MHGALSLEWRFCELLHKSAWQSDYEEKKRVGFLPVCRKTPTNGQKGLQRTALK